MSTKQSVLVLGAQGFIGRRVLAALAASGWAEPVAGVRRKGRPLPAARVCVVEATDASSISNALLGVHAVVNCTLPSHADIARSIDALLRAVRSAQSEIRIVHMSTMSVYGSAIGLVDESAALQGDLGEYSAGKVAAERLLADRPGTTILRPGCVYGPESTQWTTNIARLLLARRLGDLGAAGDGYCNLVHVEDVAAAVVRVLENPPVDCRAYNLSSPTPTTWNEYLVRFGRALGAVPVRRISGRRLQLETRILAPVLKIAQIAARASGLDPARLPPLISPSMVRLMRQEILLSTTRAEQELGLRWRDLDCGIKESARWYLESGGAA